jgi:ParB/RepB/Spo0J family partition protein
MGGVVPHQSGVAMSKQMIAAVTHSVLVASIVGDLDQFARHSPEQIERLVASIAAEGLHQPIGVLENNRLIFGHGRLLAVKRLGWAEVEAKVYPASLTETEWRVIRAIENLLRTDLNGFERWRICEELLALNPDWRAKDLAAHLKLDPSTITHLLSPSKLNDAWKEALKGGLVTIADCYAASRVDDRAQHELLAAKRDGASAAELSRRARRKPSNADQPKLSRVRIPLADGGTLVVQRPGLDIEAFIALLGDILDDARKAHRALNSIKTWVAAVRDRQAKETAQ